MAPPAWDHPVQILKAMDKNWLCGWCWVSRASVSIHQADFSNLKYEMQPDNQSGKQAFHMDGSKHFLTKLSYGRYSVQQSITDDKGLCHGVIEQILKKIARCFHALQSQLGGEPHRYIARASFAALIDHPHSYKKLTANIHSCFEGARFISPKFNHFI